jgi:hypothetical protein
MNRFFSLVLIYPLIILVSLSILLIDYERDSYDEFAQLRMSAMMNHANDAAMQVARANGQINAEGESEIDAASVWDIYKKVFLSGMNTGGDFEESAFEFATPAAVLAVNDGMYLKEPYYGTFVSYDNLDSSDKDKLQFKYFPIGSTTDPYIKGSTTIGSYYKDFIKNTERQSGYSWSQKIPYARNLVDEELKPVGNSTVKVKALTTLIKGETDPDRKELLKESYPFVVLDKINGKNLYIMDYNSYKANGSEAYIKYKDTSNIDKGADRLNYIPSLELVEDGTLYFYPEGATSASDKVRCYIHNSQKINEQICNATEHLVNKAKDVYDNKEFFIPTQFEEDTKYSAVSLKGLTLIVLIQDYDPYHTSRPLSNYSISSAELVVAKPIYCYTKDDDSKYYGYTKPATGTYTKCITLASRQEAARKGYHPDSTIYQMG